MNLYMIIEILIFVVLLLAGLILMAVLRRKLRQYDGMGDIKKKVEGRKQPPKRVL